MNRTAQAGCLCFTLAPVRSAGRGLRIPSHLDRIRCRRIDRSCGWGRPRPVVMSCGGGRASPSVGDNRRVCARCGSVVCAAALLFLVDSAALWRVAWGAGRRHQQRRRRAQQQRGAMGHPGHRFETKGRRPELERIIAPPRSSHAPDRHQPFHSCTHTTRPPEEMRPPRFKLVAAAGVRMAAGLVEANRTEFATAATSLCMRTHHPAVCTPLTQPTPATHTTTQTHHSTPFAAFLQP